MTISVVIPTYNRNRLLLERALPSVLRQTVPVDEIHIVADGMTGPPLTELSAGIAALDDPRIALWNIPRQCYPDDPLSRWRVNGLEARNFGLDKAQGDWIAPLDDDDRWTRDHIRILAKYSAHVDFVYGMSNVYWPDGRRERVGTWPPRHTAFCDGAQLYRNGMGYRYDPTCIERDLAADPDLWIRMFEGGVRFRLVHRIVHHYFPAPR